MLDAPEHVLPLHGRLILSLQLRDGVLLFLVGLCFAGSKECIHTHCPRDPALDKMGTGLATLLSFFTTPNQLPLHTWHGRPPQGWWMRGQLNACAAGSACCWKTDLGQKRGWVELYVR